MFATNATTTVKHARAALPKTVLPATTTASSKTANVFKQVNPKGINFF